MTTALPFRHLALKRILFATAFFATVFNVSAQSGTSIFRDDFNRATLGSFWNMPTSWSIKNGAAYYFDGFEGLRTDAKYTQQSFIVETAAKGFTSSYKRAFRLTFGQNDISDNNKTYVLTYEAYEGGRLVLGRSTDNVFWPETLDEAVLYPQLSVDRWYKFKVARYKSGLIQVYVDRGSGYSSVPLLEAIDRTYTGMGHISWEAYTETAPESFYVDWISAIQPSVEKPAVREKPAEDDLITQVSAKSGKKYNVAKLKTGVKTYTDRNYTVTSVPPYLSGASFIQTANDDKRNTSDAFLTAFIKKAAIVYIAYDPRATVTPRWLSSWSKTGDRIETTDPGSPYLELYSRLVEYGELYPTPLLFGGNLAGSASGALFNYLVVVIPRPYPTPLEAEDAFLSGAVVAKNQPYYSGTGFADFINASNDYIEWTVTIDVPGRYGLGFEFANGGQTDRPLQIKSDGVIVDTLQFANTGRWSYWAFTTGPTVYLSRGTHKIRTTATGSSGPNIDRMSLYFTYGNAQSSNLKKETYPNEIVRQVETSGRAYPNPFVQRTTISYQVEAKTHVSLQLISPSGQPTQTLVNATQEAGAYLKTIDGSRLAAGTYFYRLQIGNRIQVGKLVKM